MSSTYLHENENPEENLIKICSTCPISSESNESITTSLAQLTTSQMLKDKITKNIDSAKRRRLPIYNTKLKAHCDTISENIMNLLKYYLESDGSNQDDCEDETSNDSDKDNIYRYRVGETLKTSFEKKEEVKQLFRSREDLKRVFKDHKIFHIPTSESNLPQPIDDPPTLSNITAPTSDISSWMAVILVIMSTLLQNELKKLLDVNAEHLKRIEEEHESYYDEVATFLAKLNMGKYLINFENNGIIPPVFNDLTKEQLEKCGVTKPGDLQIILNAAHEYTTSYKCSKVLDLEDQKEEIRRDMMTMQKKMCSMISMQNSLNTLQTDMNAIMNKYIDEEDFTTIEKQLNQSIDKES